MLEGSEVSLRMMSLVEAIHYNMFLVSGIFLPRLELRIVDLSKGMDCILQKYVEYYTTFSVSPLYIGRGV